MGQNKFKILEGSFFKVASIVLLSCSAIALVAFIGFYLPYSVFLFVPITLGVVLWIKSEKRKLKDYKWFIFFVLFYSFFGGYFTDFFVRNSYLKKHGVISNAVIYDLHRDRAGKDWYNEYYYQFEVQDSVIYGSKQTVPTSRTFKVNDAVHVIYSPKDYSYSDIFPKTIAPNDYLKESLIKRLINTDRHAKWLIAIGVLWIGLKLIGMLLNLIMKNN